MTKLVFITAVLIFVKAESATSAIVFNAPVKFGFHRGWENLHAVIGSSSKTGTTQSKAEKSPTGKYNRVTRKLFRQDRVDRKPKDSKRSGPAVVSCTCCSAVPCGDLPSGVLGMIRETRTGDPIRASTTIDQKLDQIG
jgi:hypothetical protein